MCYSLQDYWDWRSMEKREKHFVLVHGACHGAWCWYQVATMHKSSGHRVTALDMAASGTHPKQVHEVRSHSDYLEPLIEFMASLPAEERVILVGHSMGGCSISAAMERFPEKVSVAVFCAAYMPSPDLSSRTLSAELYQRDSNMDLVITYDNDKMPTSFVCEPNYMASKLYHLSPPEDVTLGLFLVRSHPMFSDEAMFYEAVELIKENYGSVSRVYIVCDQDHALPEAFQRWTIEKNPTDDVKLISGADHMPLFSKPKELCSCLQEIAERYP